MILRTAASDRAHAHSGDVPAIRKHLFRLAPLLLCAVGAAGMYMSVELSIGELRRPGPGMWPFIISALLTGISAFLLFTDDPAEYDSWTARTVVIALSVGSLVLFVLVFKVVGFVAAAGALLTAWLRWFGEQSWRKSILMAAIGTAMLHLVFVEFLTVPFPESLIFSMGMDG